MSSKLVCLFREPGFDRLLDIDPLLAAKSRICCVISMLQNFGPHIEQKCATLAPSAGSVWSWKARAVTGSSARLN